MKLHKELIKGSFILLIAFGVYNLFNFIFHLSMARMLTIEDFGILATLFSIIYALGIFTESIQTVIMKYTTDEKNLGKVKNLIKRASKKGLNGASIIFILYLIVSIFLSPLLKIEYPLLALNGLMIFIAFMVPITRGTLQGQKKFTSLGINMVIESVSKLALAIFLVFIGWKVFGAIIATILGVVLAYGISFFQIKDTLKKKEIRTKTEELYDYSRPAFVVTLVVLAFFSLDVILAKIFFSAESAGAYSIASILAKIIFLGTHPISRAMFPLSAEKGNSKKASESIFYNALALVGIGIIVSLSFFYFFPEFVLTIFSGRVIPESLQILFFLGIGTSLLSIANLFLFYKLSLGKIKGYYTLLIFVVIEIILLSLFSSDLVSFSLAYVVAAAAFLWGSVIITNKS